MATQALFRDLKWTAFRWDSVSEWTMGWPLLGTPVTGHTARDAVPLRWGGALRRVEGLPGCVGATDSGRKLVHGFWPYAEPTPPEARGDVQCNGEDSGVGLLGQV